MVDIRMPPSGADEGFVAALQIRSSGPRSASWGCPSTWTRTMRWASWRRRRGCRLPVEGPGRRDRAIHLGGAAGGRGRLRVRSGGGRTARHALGRSAGGADPPRARCWSGWLRAARTAPSPSSVEVTERAVEKHVTSIFQKLGLPQANVKTTDASWPYSPTCAADLRSSEGGAAARRRRGRQPAPQIWARPPGTVELTFVRTQEKPDEALCPQVGRPRGRPRTRRRNRRGERRESRRAAARSSAATPGRAASTVSPARSRSAAVTAPPPAPFRCR